jgi:4'-phosphopantetheinyl transferase
MKGASIRFNITHSRGLALFAVTSRSEIGIDLEFVDPSFPVEKLAPRIFSAGELSELHTLASELQTTAFFRRWTRREAYLKGVGTGLSGDEKSLADRGIKSALLGLDIVDNWTLTDLTVDRKYTAALAMNGMINRIRYLRLGDQ